MAHTSVKISANSSDYQSQMKSAASQMKVLSSEFKLAQTQAKAFGSAADQLKAKAESLTQKITLQKNIVQLNSEHAVGPLGGVAAFKEVVVDLTDAASAGSALAAHIGLEIGHSRLLRRGRGSFLPQL